MPFQVYRIASKDRAKMDTALGDDILSRQSLTLRDARHFDQPGEFVYLFVEGTDAGILRADAMLLDFAERAPNAADLYQRLKDEEDAAAAGLGSIMGDL